MLKGINKLLTGDILKALCDMGHGDELVIADANFPADSYAKRIIRVPGIDGVTLLKAILEVFPLDTYTDSPAIIMDLTASDKQKGMKQPEIWNEYKKVLKKANMSSKLNKIERYDFYERTKNSYVVIQCGEERQYGNIILVKGVIK